MSKIPSPSVSLSGTTGAPNGELKITVAYSTVMNAGILSDASTISFGRPNSASNIVLAKSTKIY